MLPGSHELEIVWGMKQAIKPPLYLDAGDPPLRRYILRLTLLEVEFGLHQACGIVPVHDASGTIKS